MFFFSRNFDDYDLLCSLIFSRLSQRVAQLLNGLSVWFTIGYTVTVKTVQKMC